MKLDKELYRSLVQFAIALENGHRASLSMTLRDLARKAKEQARAK